MRRRAIRRQIRYLSFAQAACSSRQGDGDVAETFLRGPMIVADIGVFAHNEEDSIVLLLADLAKQSVFFDSRFSVRVVVLANGCSDNTCEAANTASGNFSNPSSVLVCKLEEGGKSRTWNRFVHNLSNIDAESLIFMDADIRLPGQNTISDLLLFLQERTDIKAASSLPVKDIDFRPERLKLIEKLISSGSQVTGPSSKTSICGQLYVMRSAAARKISLPIGLPVEDGFVRHALITELFSRPINDSVIDQPDRVFHVYSSERHISSLLTHQTRIVIGSAINASLFSHFISMSRRGAHQEVLAQIEESSQSSTWLPNTMRALLPSREGWVPLLFLYGRTRAFYKTRPHSARRSLMALIALGFDVVVYVLAQIKMARGAGAGYW